MFGNRLMPEGRVFVKICGITNQADALAAIDAGADALGFNLVPQSKRYIDIRLAAEWIQSLPRKICKVAVMKDPLWEDALRTSQLPFIDGLQLHGSESPEFCRRLAEAGVRFAKALPVRGSESFANVSDFFTDTIILDSASGADFGGSGKVFPWRFAKEFVQTQKKLRLVVAGGLDASNVSEAIATVCPYGVDVTTGVEISPGRKDHRQLKIFVEAVRTVRPASI
jgi:phosphoribosylanthranilate isomerase